MPSIKLRIEELNGVLQLSKSLLGDASAKTGSKSLGFIISEENSEFFFLTNSNIIRRNIEVLDHTLENGEDWVFTVTPEELTKLVDSYKSLAMTVVDNIELTKNGDFLNVRVAEVPANENIDESYGQVSDWRLNVSEPTPNDMKRARLDFPEETVLIAPTRLNGYLKALLPLLSKTGSGAVNQINFTQDYIFVKPTSITAEFRNQLVEGGTRDFTLTSAGATSVLELVNAAMSDLVALNLEEGENPEDIENVKIELGFHYPKSKKPKAEAVEGSAEGSGEGSGEETSKPKPLGTAKPDYIVFRYGGVELFLRNSVTTQIRLGNSADIFKVEDRDGSPFYPERQMGVVVDRRYYQNILQRLGASSDNVTISFDVEEQVMLVETDRFTQKVPLLNIKGDMSEVKLAVSLRLLSKAVLGDDATFTREHTSMFMYFSPSNQRGYRMAVMDPTNVWATLISVNSKK